MGVGEAARVETPGGRVLRLQIPAKLVENSALPITAEEVDGVGVRRESPGGVSGEVVTGIGMVVVVHGPGGIYRGGMGKRRGICNCRKKRERNNGEEEDAGRERRERKLGFGVYGEDA